MVRAQNELEIASEETMIRYLKRWWSHVVSFGDKDELAVITVLHALAFPDNRECDLECDDAYFLYDEVDELFVDFCVSITRVIKHTPFLEGMDPEKLAADLVTTALEYDKNAMITTGVCLAPKYMGEHMMTIRVWLD